MKVNPIYTREVRASSRNLKLPMALMGFNGILAAAALVNMYSVLYQVRTTAEIQFSGFLEMYAVVAAIEFALLLFIMPAIASGSISGEREHRTLELLLTTQTTPGQIVRGKLMASLGNMFLILVASFPVVAMVFVYGGITWTDLAVTVLCFVVTALLVTGIGLYCSAALKRTVVSTAVSYGGTALLVAGTCAINHFALGLSTMRWNSYMNQIGGVANQASSGGFLYLLLFNPAVTFYCILNDQAGVGSAIGKVGQWFGFHEGGVITEHWVLISMAVQLVTALLLIRGAIRWIDPASGKEQGQRRKKREERKLDR